MTNSVCLSVPLKLKNHKRYTLQIRCVQSVQHGAAFWKLKKKINLKYRSILSLFVLLLFSLP